MATKRLRPEDWAAVPQTRIQIRAAPGAHEPREERMRMPKCAQKPPRPTPINYPPGESPPISQGGENLDIDSPRAPEVVDFAAPDAWPRRGLPSHIVYQHQQWAGRRVGSPGSVSQYSSWQSEMSFGILDYYTRDPSPTRSETLPPTPKLLQIAQDAPKIGTPVIDPAMEKFDFGLPLKAVKLQPPKSGKPDAFESGTATPHAKPGDQQPDRGSINSTPPIPPPKSDKSEPARTTYSLFPKGKTPPSRPSLSLTNRQDSSPTHTTATSGLPIHQPPDPSYRPRKESLSSSLRSRKDSYNSYRPNAPRIPLRVFSSPSNSPSTSAYTTPRTSHAVRASSSTTASTASPPTSSGARSQSRWSEDTITSPTATALAPRASFGSLLRDVGDSGGGEGEGSGRYPACFFEDDDDEVVPLRRKLAWGKGGGKGGRGSWETEWEREAGSLGGRGVGWRRWMLCGCGR